MSQAYRLKEFNRLAGKGTTEHRLISDGDRILVALSGGKDSLAMLHFLHYRRKRTPITYDLVAVHLDMGHEKEEDKERFQERITEFGIPYYAEDTDFALRAHSSENRENPCFLCSRLRRQRLFELTRDLGCSKTALGHHRDDLIETLLLNIFYSGEISTMMPRQEFFGGLLTVIRPLCMVPEEKIIGLSDVWGRAAIPNHCPSAGRTKRKEVKDIIERLARGNDKIKGNIFRSLSNYRPDYLLGRGGSSGRPSRIRNRKKSTPKNQGKANAMENEKRKRTRVNFKASVDLSTPEVTLTDLASRDLSLKGLYVETDARLPLETKVDITLKLSGTSSLVSLKMKGFVARVDEKGLGVDFDEVDLDSFFHLRNIILYNAGDPADVDEELATRPAFD